MNKTEKYNYLRTVLLKQQAPFTQKDTVSARARGNIGITKSDKVARGRARRVSVLDHSRGCARAHIANLRLKIKICGGECGGDYLTIPTRYCFYGLKL